MSVEPVTVRLATASDADVVAQMLIDFNAEFDETAPAHEVLATRLRALIDGDRFFVLVAGVPAVGLATVALRPSPFFAGGAAYLEDLYVEPELRGQGIGSALMALLRTELDQRGVGLLEVGVDEPDVEALRFYERHGLPLRSPGTGDRAFHLYRELGAD